MLIWVSQQNIVTYNINFAVIVANTILGYVISSKRDIVCPKHSHKMPIHYDILDYYYLVHKVYYNIYTL